MTAEFFPEIYRESGGPHSNYSRLRTPTWFCLMQNSAPSSQARMVSHLPPPGFLLLWSHGVSSELKLLPCSASGVLPASAKKRWCLLERWVSLFAVVTKERAKATRYLSPLEWPPSWARRGCVNNRAFVVRLNNCAAKDFPGGPLVKTLFFQCKGLSLNPWLGN